jgi:hypothetical protein
MQIKTTRKYLFIPIEMAIIKKQKITSVSKGVEKLEPWYMAYENVKWYSQYSSSSKKIKHRKNTIPKFHEVKAGTQTDICTPMLIAAFLKMAKRWRQPKSSLVAE